MNIARKLFFIFLPLISIVIGMYLILSDQVSIEPGWDKLCHFGGFFLGTIIFSISFINLINISKYFNYYLVSVCLLGGVILALLEILQEKYSLARESDPIDWFAGLIGMAIAVLLIYLYLQYKEKKGKENDL